MLKTEEMILIKNISKLKSTEILQVLENWSYLTPTDVELLRSNIDGKQTKRNIANVILDCCKEKGSLNLNNIGELELLCVQIHAAKRQWNAYQLSSKHGKKRADTSSPTKFKQRLTKQIKLYFSKECCTSVLLHHGLLWGWVYLPKPGSKAFQPTRCLYFVHYPDTPVVIFSGMRAGFADFMKHCLVVALGYQEITEMSLSGHHLESLAELAINKLAEGGFTKFQQTHRPNGPLGELTTRKRKACEPFDSCVTDENRASKKQRLTHLTDTFGENQQPTLEKIEFRVELPYRSKTIAPDLRRDGEIFHSRVKLVGKNALEGIRNLAEHGYASLPLPKHLTCVPSRARNYFLLTKAQKSNETVQNRSASAHNELTKKSHQTSDNTNAMGDSTRATENKQDRSISDRSTNVSENRQEVTENASVRRTSRRSSTARR